MNVPIFLLWCLAAFSAWQMPLCAYAQIDPPPDLGYDPPEGWEYIRRMDSLDFVFYVHNDSIYMASRTNALNSPHVFEHSTDGGKSWRPSTSVQPINHIYAQHVRGTTILWNELVDKDTIHTLMISTDLGQTWQERVKMNDFVLKAKERVLAYSENGQGIVSDIHDPLRTWFVKYAPPGSGWPLFNHQFMYFTTDAGYTWKLLEIPAPPGWQYANYVIFEIKFDYREPGAWYFMSRGVEEDHFGNTTTVTEYYVSRDKGQTFTQIPLLGDMVGVTGVGEHFYWLREKDQSIISYRIVDSNLKEDTVNILQQILPEKFPRDTSSGYLSIDNSLISYLHPNEIAYRINEQINDSLYMSTSWLFYSDDGVTFKKLWERVNSGIIGWNVLDQGTGTIYFRSFDFAARKSLWKRRVFSNSNSGVRSKDFSLDVPSVTVIYTLDKHPELVIRQPKTVQTRITLCDILGRELFVVYDNILHNGEYRFKLWEVTRISPQPLFITIESSGWSQTEKVFINH